MRCEFHEEILQNSIIRPQNAKLFTIGAEIAQVAASPDESVVIGYNGRLI